MMFVIDMPEPDEMPEFVGDRADGQGSAALEGQHFAELFGVEYQLP